MIRGKKALESDSDNAEADDLTRRIQDEMPSLGEHALPFHELFLAKPSIQRRVLLNLRPHHKPGRPKKPITDEDWRIAVEDTREELRKEAHAAGCTRRVTAREAIIHLLKTTGTRWKREAGVPFRPHTPSGKAEIKRIQDAVVRARRPTKSKQMR